MHHANIPHVPLWCASLYPLAFYGTLDEGTEEESEVVHGINLHEAGGLLSKNLEKFLLTNGNTVFLLKIWHENNKLR